MNDKIEQIFERYDELCHELIHSIDPETQNIIRKKLTALNQLYFKETGGDSIQRPEPQSNLIHMVAYRKLGSSK